MDQIECSILPLVRMLRLAQTSKFFSHPIQYIEIPGLAVLMIVFHTTFPCIMEFISCCIITGGDSQIDGVYFADVLDYDPNADKWTKVGTMTKGRWFHSMSLVPKETADYCV